MTVRDFPDGFFKCGVAAVNITEYMNFFVVGEINRTDIDKGVGIHKKTRYPLYCGIVQQLRFPVCRRIMMRKSSRITQYCHQDCIV